MNISSTPFIRNDYWPDYNDINELNQRINEAENETALVNARLSNDIENVSANLNGYMDSQADTVTTNNVIVNSLNANYAVGGYANFANTNTDNAYVENLTVNKPIFDITLNTPHIENATSLGGNFYNTNLINPSFEEIGSMSLDSLTVNTANIKELFVNTEPEPVTSSAVLGYDSEGRVIPIHASYDVGFPEDANYLFTDHAGTAFAGEAATEVDASSNLITAHAVKNAIDGVTADVSDNFNIINDALNDVDSWMNNIENDVNNRFEDVASQFNDVNNRFEDVASQFNDVNNSFNDVNNSFNNANDTANNLLANVDYLKATLAPLLNLPVANVSGWVNSDTPVNIQGITSFVVAPFVAPAITGSDVGDGAKLNVNGTVATLALPGIQWTKENMNGAFENCYNFNQNIQIPEGVISLSGTFMNCYNFNQNIQIPEGVISLSGTFMNCYNFNQNIQIPEGVTDMSNTFSGCLNYLQAIYVPDTFTNVFDYANDSFYYAVNATFNQNIKLPFTLTNMSYTFSDTAFNQNIVIPEGATDMSGALIGATWPAYFRYSSNNALVCDEHDEPIMLYCFAGQFNQNILIPNSVANFRFALMDQPCFNQNIFIPNSVTDMSQAFTNCVSLNQNILIPNSVTNIRYILCRPQYTDIGKMIKDNEVLDFPVTMSFNQPDMYIYSQNITNMEYAFEGCHINNIHVPTSVPKDTSNYMYNCLVNGNTGITFPAANIFNDLPVDIEQWPPL